MKSHIVVEICTDNWDDTIDAIRLGADRIELCSDLSNDGLTPSMDLLERVLNVADKKNVTVFPMIRSRAGDFVYNAEEKQKMLADAKHMASVGAHGIVVGALTSEGHIDIQFISAISHAVRAVNPKIEITFHKAIDYARIPPGKCLGDVVADLEPFCDRVLTSGHRPTALEGAEAIRTVVARNRRPFVLAAGKIRQENVVQIVDLLQVSEVHSRSPLVAVALGKPQRSV